MDKKGFTIEVTSRYDGWWRYNAALMCGCFDAADQRIGFASAESAVAAVGANPWSAYGWHFEPDKFVRALREVIDLPVVNVKED